MLGGDIKVVLTLDDKDFSIKTVKATQTAKQMAEDISNTAKSVKVLEDRFTSFGQKLRDATLSISVARFALRDFSDIVLALPRAVITASAEVEKMTALMMGLSKETSRSAREADALRNQKFVFDISKTAPFEVKALGDAFVKLKVAGLDPTKGALQALVDSVAKFGGGAEELKRASIAIQQMAGKGVISMEELRQQLGEAVPDAMQAMALATGTSMAELAAKVSKGTVSAKGNIERMLTVMQLTNSGSAAEMSKTWVGMVEKMRTSWMLFMNDVGKDGFFNRAKDGLRGLLDGFQGEQSRNFAATLGKALDQVTQALIASTQFVVRFSDEIKFAGQAMLLYFAAGKLKSIGEGIRSALNNEELQRSRQNWTDRLTASRRAQAAELAEKIKFNQDLIAQNEKSRDADIRSAQRAAVQKQRMDRDTALNEARQAEARAKILNSQAVSEFKLSADRLKIMEQNRAAAEADLRYYEQQLQRRRNLSTVAGVSDPSIQRALEARRAEAASILAERNASIVSERAASVAALNAASAERARAEALRQTAQAMNKTRAEILAGLPTQTQNTAILNAQNANLKETVKNLQAKAEAATKVTFATRAMGGAIAGLQNVFNAMGGWTMVAVTALAYLGQKLYEFLNRWQRAKEIGEEIRRNIAPDDDRQAALEARRSELEQKVAQLTARISAGTAPGAAAQVALQGKQLEDARAQLTKFQTELDAMSRLVSSGKVLRADGFANDAIQTMNRLLEAQSIEFRASMRTNIAALEKAKEDALKVASEKDRANISKTFDDKIREQFRAEATKEVAMWQDTVDKIKKIYEDTQRSGTENQKAVTQKSYLAAVDGLNRAKELKQQTDELGKIDSLAAKNEKVKIERDNPLERLLIQTRADLNKSKIELEALKRDAVGFADQKAVATAEIIGKIVHGDLDFKSTDGKSVEYLGGKEQRKKIQDDFLAFLREGRTDVDRFVDGIANLSIVERDRIKEIIAGMASINEAKLQEKGLADARTMSANAQSDLNAAMEDYDKSLAKTSTFDKMVKHFDQLATKVGEATRGMNEFMVAKTKALADTAVAAAFRFGADATKDEGRTDIVNSRNVMAQAQAERDLKIRLADETYNAVKGNLDLAAKDHEQYSRAVEAAERGRNAKIREANAEYTAATRTDMDRLRDTWANSTQAMNQATANWASTFMDNVTDALIGVNVKWRDFLRSMLRDLLAVNLKKQFGDQVASAFDGIGAIFKKTLGLEGAAKSAGGSKDSANDTTAKIEEAASKTFEEWGTKASEWFSAMKDGWSSMVDTVGGYVGGLFDQLVSWVMTLFATTQGAEAASDSADGLFASFFADGGIMTSAGAMPLRAYAKGGVARSPQVTVFGEGSMPEAYVPLPDGRSIPVTVNGNSNSGNTVMINITVNKDGSADTSTAGVDKSNWSDMADKVRALVESEIVRQKRPGGQLQSVS